jgi:hypothetical protein
MPNIFASFLTSNLLAVSKGGFLSWAGSDKTVPGSTDGILTMGLLIVLIIIVPILATRRRWMK